MCKLHTSNQYIQTFYFLLSIFSSFGDNIASVQYNSLIICYTFLEKFQKFVGQYLSDTSPRIGWIYYMLNN